MSTRSCDIDEAKAIREVFGAAADEVPVTAAKSYFGNLGAGSGMIELIASVLALQQRQAVPDAQLRNARSRMPHRRGHPNNGSVSPGHSFLNLSVTPQGQASAVLVQAMN